jgi:CRP-like cAMP-binding protein
MKRERKLPFDPKVFLSKVNGGRAISDYRKDQNVYTQGERADSVFYIQSGKVKKIVISEQGKEAVAALLGTGDFFGEGCLTGQPLRHPPRASICRAIHRAPLGSQQSCRGGPG